jgi:hypothetical protein
MFIHDTRWHQYLLTIASEVPLANTHARKGALRSPHPASPCFVLGILRVLLRQPTGRAADVWRGRQNAYIRTSLLATLQSLNLVSFKTFETCLKPFRVVFWDILPSKMIVDRRFRGAYCLHHQGSVYPRRQLWTSYSPPWELEISHCLKPFILCAPT